MQEFTFLERIDERCKNTIENLLLKNKLDKTRLYGRIQREVDMNPKITNVSGFVTRLLKDFNLSDYSINEIALDPDAWKKKWDDKGFSGGIDWIVTIRVYEHMMNEYPITLDEIRDLNNKVTEYCISKELTDYSNILEFVLKSKLAKKCNIPVEVFRKQEEEGEALLREFKERDKQAEEDWYPFSDPELSKAAIEEMNKSQPGESEQTV